MITLDGVMQAPGGTDEDRSGGFKFGGWVAPYNDADSGKMMQKLLEPADLLLGRKTFDIWEDYWPKHADFWPGINEVTKYIVSTTRKESGWKNSVFMDGLEAIKKLKNSDGGDLKIWGSSELTHLLLENDLIDEFWLMIHPLILGQGKKPFADGSVASAFKLLESSVTPSGVIFAHYERAGAVKTGNVGP